MKSVNIDDETFAFWSRQAAARGLSVEEWLKTVTAAFRGPEDLSIEVRLKRFDELTETMAQMKISSGGLLDDSRETIYDQRCAPESGGSSWHARLKAFVDRHRPTGVPMDDSRESIY